MPRKKKQTALIIKAPTKYTIVDEEGNVRGTSPSYVSAIDIMKQIGFTDSKEVTLEQCLQHIYSEGGSLHGLELNPGTGQDSPEDGQDAET